MSRLHDWAAAYPVDFTRDGKAPTPTLPRKRGRVGVGALNTRIRQPN
ncbi:hypothetical protein WCLP8_5150020 [uncultured Gammaproteobacteria bacterium]